MILLYFSIRSSIGYLFPISGGQNSLISHLVFLHGPPRQYQSTELGPDRKMMIRSEEFPTSCISFLRPAYLISEGDIEDCHDQRDQQKARECKKKVEKHQSRPNLFSVNLALVFLI